MLGKNLVFYFVSSTIIAIVAQALGADVTIVLLTSMLVPPAILLAIAILHYSGRI